jgi:hypothetical protein
MTQAVAFIWLPVAAVIVLRHRNDRRRLFVALAFLGGAVLQVIAVVSARDEVVSLTSRPPVLDIPAIYASRVVLSGVVGERVLITSWDRIGIGGLVIVVCGCSLAIGVLASKADARRRAVGVALLCSSLAVFTAEIMIRGAVYFDPATWYYGGSRYVLIPLLLFLTGGFVLIEGILSAALRRGVILGVTAWSVVVMASGYHLWNPRSPGPTWAASLDGAISECAGSRRASVDIPVTPSGWFVSAPCSWLRR